VSSPIPKNRAAGRGFIGFSRAPFLLPTFLSGEERKVGYCQSGHRLIHRYLNLDPQLCIFRVNSFIVSARSKSDFLENISEIIYSNKLIVFSNAPA
jgi:hypothetical protein